MMKAKRTQKFDIRLCRKHVHSVDVYTKHKLAICRNIYLQLVYMYTYSYTSIGFQVTTLYGKST